MKVIRLSHTPQIVSTPCIIISPIQFISTYGWTYNLLDGDLTSSYNDLIPNTPYLISIPFINEIRIWLEKYTDSPKTYLTISF